MTLMTAALAAAAVAGEQGVSIFGAAPFRLRFTSVTPVLVTKLRMETAGQDAPGEGPQLGIPPGTEAPPAPAQCAGDPLIPQRETLCL